MLLTTLNTRAASIGRIVALALIAWSLFSARHAPSGSGRGLVISVVFGCAVVCWLVWTAWSSRRDEVTPDIYLMAAAGALLTAASPDSAASVFAFVAVITAALRVEVLRAMPVVVAAVLGQAVGVLVYSGSGLSLLAYALGFAASALAASNGRQRILRVEQAELLLAQTQRSHEEQLRAARLEESTRIARDIHDVLAHSLAGLTIQLEATKALIQQGAGREAVLDRVERAHQLAREGLSETRRAVGALRGDPVAASAGIEALVEDYRSAADGAIALTIDGDRERLAGATGETVLRAVQEALTNVRKHARGADVSVELHAGQRPGEEVVLVVEDRTTGDRPAPRGALPASGGGFGLRGMRERAQSLGGTLSSGPVPGGWRVELRLPAPAGPDDVRPVAVAQAEGAP